VGVAEVGGAGFSPELGFGLSTAGVAEVGGAGFSPELGVGLSVARLTGVGGVGFSAELVVGLSVDTTVLGSVLPASWGYRKVLVIKKVAPTVPKTARTDQSLTDCLWTELGVVTVGAPIPDGWECWS
jgi:hypothetical protein